MLSRKPRTTSDIRHISVPIQRSYQDVYKFASNPANLSRWMEGLSGTIKEVDGEWVGDSVNGKVTVRFAEANPFGVLDHEVELENGYTFFNILRVVPNGQKSEIIFTLFRQPDMNQAKLDEDAQMIENDLMKVKELLESEA